jgi:Dickkopf N-terminal cysteine-rich region
MRSLLLLSSLVAAGCGIGSYNEFRDQLATRWCERQLRCGEIGASESNTHCSVSLALLLTERGAVDVPTAIGDGREKLHPDNAAWCLDAVAHAPCDPVTGTAAIVDKCSGVVTGTVANGGTCWGNDECIGGVCVAPDCGGTCTGYAPPGAPCVESGGTPDVTCDPSVHYCADDGTCHHKGSEGAACSDDVQCLFDFTCVVGKCGTSARVQQGNVCGSNQPPCEDALYCDENGTCQPLVADGAPCAKADACQVGMTCQSGVCAPWLDVGGACVAGPAAIASGCPATQTCTAGACAVAPGVKAGPLAQCASDADCADGLYCSTPGNYCFYVNGVNAGCQSDHECAPDLQCVGSACHTPGYIMCATAM